MGMEADLILNQNELVRKLDMKYTNYICQLLKQKSLILNDLQRQFIEQRIRIKQTFSNQQSGDNHYNNNHKNENQIRSNPMLNEQSPSSIKSLSAITINSEIPNILSSEINVSSVNEQKFVPLNSLEQQIAYIASLSNV